MELVVLLSLFPMLFSVEMRILLFKRIHRNVAVLAVEIRRFLFLLHEILFSFFFFFLRVYRAFEAHIVLRLEMH